MGRGRLTREELAVLELVNGKNTVKDIIRKSRMGSFEVSKMLYRLLRGHQVSCGAAYSWSQSEGQSKARSSRMLDSPLP